MLKKIAFAALGSVAALALASVPASALTLGVSGTVAPVCAVLSTASAATISLTTNAAQNGVSLNYKCNSPTGFHVDFSSQNNGYLVNTADSTSKIAWEGSQTGDHGLTTGTYSLSSPQTLNVTANPAFISGVAAQTYVTVPTATTAALYAGTYSDVVTVAVSVNP